MKVDEDVWKFMQKHLGFTDEELELFRSNPNEMRLNRVGCFAVGIRCGGWGHIALEVKIEDRE